jgi:hypothetical protein
MTMSKLQCLRSKRYYAPRVIWILSVLALLLLSTAPAQQAVKRPLTHNDYDSWRSIQGQQLSDDGKLLAYALIPQDSDGEIVVRNLATGTEWRQNRGSRQATGTEEPSETAPVPAPAPGGGRGGGGRGGGMLNITPDSRWLIFQIAPTRADNEKARKEKRRPDEMPRNALGVMDLTTGEVTRIERVRNFQVPEDGAGFIAYQLEPKTPERKTDAAAATEKTQPPAAPAGGRGAAAGGQRRTEYGSDLVLRNMNDKSERVFADVSDYSLTRDAKGLVYTVSSRKEDSNGVYAFEPGTTADPKPLLTGKGKYTRLTWDEKQTQLAFLSDRDDAAAKQPRVKIYHWLRTSPAAVELISTATPGFRQGFVISEPGGISFAADGSRIFFGIAPPPEPPPDPDAPAIPEDEKVNLDLWHWKDDFIQPMQKVRANQTRNRSYRAVMHLKEKNLVQLADETMEGINPTRDGRYALGTDDRPYRMLVGYDTNYSDYFLVDTLDGSRKPLRQKMSGGLSWSPTGKYVLFFDSKDWNTISIPDGTMVNLTQNLNVKFWNE